MKSKKPIENKFPCEHRESIVIGRRSILDNKGMFRDMEWCRKCGALRTTEEDSLVVRWFLPSG